VSPCSLVHVYQHFGGACSLHQPNEWDSRFIWCCCPSTPLKDVTPKKTVIFIVAAVETSISHEIKFLRVRSVQYNICVLIMYFEEWTWPPPDGARWGPGDTLWRKPQEYVTCSSRPWPSDTTLVWHLICLPALAVYHCDSTKMQQSFDCENFHPASVSGKPHEMLFYAGLLQVVLQPMHVGAQ
jgi:hypothetical protein